MDKIEIQPTDWSILVIAKFTEADNHTVVV